MEVAQEELESDELSRYMEGLELKAKEAEEPRYLDDEKTGRADLKISSVRSTASTHEGAVMEWGQEDLGPEELPRSGEIAGDVSEKGGSNGQLSSKKAEEPRYLDDGKTGRAVWSHLKIGSVRSTAGVDWAQEDLEPDELSRYVEGLELKAKAREEPRSLDGKAGRALGADPKISSVRSTAPTNEGAGMEWTKEDMGPDELSRYVEVLELKEAYIDTVLDMEDILLDADGDGSIVSSLVSPQGKHPSKGGSVGASSSTFKLISGQAVEFPCNLSEVGWIEVVGALQRRGETSLGDRVVGVKEHTIYRMKVNGAGHTWEIQRRWRDFVLLHNQLLELFAHKGTDHLPSVWEEVRPNSHKVFGNTSPIVVEVRSALIQSCLQSLLQAGPPLSTASPLLRFLFPDGPVSHSIGTGYQWNGDLPLPSGWSSREGEGRAHSLSDDVTDSSPESDTMMSKIEPDQDHESRPLVFGKRIPLIVQLQEKKSPTRLLRAQHHTCAGCYKHLDLTPGFLPELAQKWGWSGPRFCEYSGQMFCSTCHLNETAILPARVLQRWDFAPHYVSQLAKAYLDSIYDKPMLCVSAVNPYLYARVPVLALLTDIRRTLSKMIACIRCPARTPIHAMMGSRCYFLENNDFFALRDLEDMSKGAFGVLPGYMQAVLLKLSVHITRDCSACRELGEACGAGELCDDPFDVIYPYQDKAIMRCHSCQSPYHKRCFLMFNKCFTCRKCQSVKMLKSPEYGSDLYSTHLHVESDLRTTVSSSRAVESKDPSVGPSIPPVEKIVKAKKSLLGTISGAEEIQYSDFEKEEETQSVLNKSAIYGPLELEL